MPKARLSSSVIDAIKPSAGNIVTWDTDVTGLAVVCTPSGTKSFVVNYRHLGRERRLTISRCDLIGVTEARKRARAILADVAEGRDPLQEKREAAEEEKRAVRFAEFAEDYLKDAAEGRVRVRGKAKKASTLATDTGRVTRHLIPLIGDRKVKDLTAKDVEDVFHKIAAGKTAFRQKRPGKAEIRVTGGEGTARRTIRLLQGILSHAVKLGVIEQNPAHGVDMGQDKRRQERVTEEEYQRLGNVLREMETTAINITAVRVVWLMAMTGLRRSEALKLRWREVDLEGNAIRFSDTKSGQQIRPIGQAAVEVLKGWKDTAEGEFVFPAGKGKGHWVNIRAPWLRIVEAAECPHLTPHILRHGLASVAGDLGYSELTIAGLLGHHTSSVTGRYVHVDKSLVAAADAVSEKIAALMAPAAQLVEISDKRKSRP